MSRKTGKTIAVLLAMVSLCLAAFVQKQEYTVKFPKGLYTYTLTTGDVVKVKLLGGASTDGLYCQLLFGGTFLDVDATSNLANCAADGDDLTFTYTITLDDDYLVWVFYNHADDKIVAFNIEITVNGNVELDE